MNRLLFFIFASILIECILLSGTFGQGHGHGHGHGPRCCNTKPSDAQTQKKSEFKQFAEDCKRKIGKNSQEHFYILFKQNFKK